MSVKTACCRSLMAVALCRCCRRDGVLTEPNGNQGRRCAPLERPDGDGGKDGALLEKLDGNDGQYDGRCKRCDCGKYDWSRWHSAKTNPSSRLAVRRADSRTDKQGAPACTARRAVALGHPPLSSSCPESNRIESNRFETTRVLCSWQVAIVTRSFCVVSCKRGEPCVPHAPRLRFWSLAQPDAD